MTAAPAPLLAAHGLRKAYGRGDAAVQAVAGIDIELRAGELVAIMGASGSGKSTLLHLLGGLLRPDAGSIRFDGQDLAALGDAAVTRLRQRGIGVVFQAFNLMPTLSALDNAALPLLLAGAGRAAARAAACACLERVGLADRAGRLPAQLSGGEQQRVAIARALVAGPRVILADEPTGNLDRRNAQEVCRALREAAADPARAVAVVTHEAAVAFHADRIVVLADGRIADTFDRSEAASAEELGARYLRASI